MADPGIPDDMGGRHVFLADPQQAGLSTMVGDMAALNLQLIHLLAADAVPDANRAAVDQIAA